MHSVRNRLRAMWPGAPQDIDLPTLYTKVRIRYLNYPPESKEIRELEEIRVRLGYYY